ncbi:uncharacterized protein B0H18DRAFT_879312, partial [Fomitopsis serialis]|uniref:uncharacterized protein n=1 Tax=Fomitopsis serialis TaxID=139415 RepID=UPI002008655A
GWGSLIAAAGVSYYYARQSINERRKAQDLTGARPSEKLDCMWPCEIIDMLSDIAVPHRACTDRSARAERRCRRRSRLYTSCRTGRLYNSCRTGRLFRKRWIIITEVVPPEPPTLRLASSVDMVVNA